MKIEGGQCSQSSRIIMWLDKVIRKEPNDGSPKSVIILAGTYTNYLFGNKLTRCLIYEVLPVPFSPCKITSPLLSSSAMKSRSFRLVKIEGDQCYEYEYFTEKCKAMDFISSMTNGEVTDESGIEAFNMKGDGSVGFYEYKITD